MRSKLINISIFTLFFFNIDKSSLNETNYSNDDNNHKKAIFFSIESLLTDNKSNSTNFLESVNEKANFDFEVPEGIFLNSFH